MKKFTFVLLIMLGFMGLTMAQTIEDFESLKMNLMAGGANDQSSFTVIPNPDKAGINTSYNVVKFLRDKDGVPWEGFYATLASSVDLTANKYVHVKVWKPRISPVKFKLEGAVNLEVASMSPQTVVNGWEELVFDFSTLTGDYTKIVFMPDFEDPLALTNDITLYFDEIMINNDPAVGSAAVKVMEDYDHIALNYMLGGGDDLSTMTILPNPDKSGNNLSEYVIKFHRDMNGVPWGGFWSALPVPADVTTNKYVHAKVWKPRISPVKLKLEGGAAGTFEAPSMYPQTKTGAWEDIVFDFSAKTGPYPILAFMPDFADPVNLTEDIDIYFDDFLINNDPNPIMPAEQIFSVDMTGSGILAGDRVFISGALGGVNGTWNEPGTNPNNEMFDPDGDNVFTVYMHLADGLVAYKFFKGTAWGGGEPVASDRTFTISGSCNNVHTWGIAGFVTSTPENSLAGKVQMYPNPVSSELFIKSTVELSKVTITNAVGKIVGNYAFNSGTQSISTSTLNSGLYFITFTSKDGSQLTQKLMKN